MANGPVVKCSPEVNDLCAGADPLAEGRCRVRIDAHAVPLGQGTVGNKDKTSGFLQEHDGFV